MKQNIEKKSKDKINFSTGIIAITLFVSVLLGIIIISYIRSNKKEIFPEEWADAKKPQAALWLKAMQNKDEKQAILLAKQMVRDDNPEMPDTDYIQLLFQLRLSTMVLTSPFNHFDFLRWQDAYLAKQIVNSTEELTNKKSSLELLFKKMTERVKLIKPSKGYKPSPTIAGIWNKKTGNTRELCRLFAAIAEQAGYSVQVISLFNEKDQVLHVFCEVRKGEKSSIVDPRFSFVAPDASAASYASSPDTIPKAWPPQVAACINKRLYELPAEAADYKIINSQLYTRLSALKGNSIPLFAQSPRMQISDYIKKYSNKSKNTAFTYWTFPFDSLKSSQDFPKDWILKFRKAVDK